MNAARPRNLRQTDTAAGLVRPLLEGPLDVVGDVHGEHAALETLMERLGYERDGRHPQGRRLVFVGDLCDRGPDSVAVVRRVQGLVDDGFAQCIAGNHELNILRCERKHGNHWFYGDTTDARHPEYGVTVAASDADRNRIAAFFRSLPLVLERPDLRIVHAVWHDAAVERLRTCTLDAAEAYEAFERDALASPEGRDLDARKAEATRELGDTLADRTARPADWADQIAALGAYDEFVQTSNPVRMVTSGFERRTASPFFANKWRGAERVAWWKEYDGPPVLFGHYWRWWNPALQPVYSKGEPNLFDDDPVGPAMAEHHRAFCVDFSAGARFKERHEGRSTAFHGRLAAMRWPERELVYDAAPAGLV
jgi:hypothetical protein